MSIVFDDRDELDIYDKQVDHDLDNIFVISR